MTETPHYFSGGEHELFGVLHMPSPQPRGPAHVLCAPFGEERLWSHRVLVNFARELASRGHAVLRFDYGGTGDSEGDSRDVSVASCIADIAGAVARVRDAAGGGDVVLTGVRFGATLAALAAPGLPSVGALVLWEPLLKGGDYMRELLRTHLAMQMALYREVRQDRDALAKALREGAVLAVDGYEITPELYEQMSAIDLSVAPVAPSRCLAVRIGREAPPVSPRDLVAYAARYAEGSAIAITGEPFWREGPVLCHRSAALYAATLDWLAGELHAA